MGTRQFRFKHIFWSQEQTEMTCNNLDPSGQGGGADFPSVVKLLPQNKVTRENSIIKIASSSFFISTDSVCEADTNVPIPPPTQ